MSSKIVKVKAKAAEMTKQELVIRTDHIKLDAALKFSGEVGTGGEAKLAISEGRVFVNGEKCLERGKKLYPGDRFRFGRTDRTVVKKQDL